MTLSASSGPASTPGTPQSPVKRRGLRVTVGILAALILLLVGYTVGIAVTPPPAPKVMLSMPVNEEFTVDPETAQTVVDEQKLPTAIGWADQEELWANDPAAYPLASVSKLITVLVSLEKEPLDPGAAGPIHVWSEADAALQAKYLADDGVAYPIPVGTEVSLRQILTLTLLPSANDFAAAYAYSVFGDNEAFIAAVDDWKARQGLETLVMVEPTGMDEGNVASVSDALRIGRLALANPTIAEFTRMPSAELPWGIGTIENTNPLLTELPGIIGVKTGRSSSAGFNYVVAQESEAFGRPLVKMSVTFGRPSLEARAQSGREMLGELEALPQQVSVVKDGATVGSAATVDGMEIPLIANGSATAVLLPGEVAQRVPEVAAVGVGAAGAKVGTIRIEAPAGDQDVEVVTTAEVAEPDFWWRFTHPAAVFGWG